MISVLEVLQSADMAGLILRSAAIATLVMAFAFALSWLCSRQSAAQRHTLWLACMLTLLLLPLLAHVAPAWRISIRPVDRVPPDVTTPPNWSDIGNEHSANAPLADAAAIAPSEEVTSDDKPVVAMAESRPELAEHADEARQIGSKQAPAVATASEPVAPALAEVRRVEPTAAQLNLNWKKLATAVWLVGAMSLLAYYVLCHGLALHIICRASDDDTDELARHVELLAANLGVRASRVAVRYFDRTVSPMTFGWRRPVILLPVDSRVWRKQQLRHVLIHELAHIKRHDWAAQVLGQLACALYWFHPLVWLAAARLRRAADGAADDVVLSMGVEAPKYGESLVSVARLLKRRTALGSAAVPMARLNSFETRVRAILSDKRNRKSSSRQRLWVSLAALCLVATPVARVRFPVAADDGTKEPANNAEKSNMLSFDDLPKGIATVLGSRRFRSDWDQLSICYSSDARVIATGNRGSIDFFDVNTGERLKHFDATDPLKYESFQQLQLINNDTQFVCSVYPNARVFVWNINEAKPAVTVRAHDRNVVDLDVSPDERSLATCGDDGTIRLWETATGNKRLEIKLKRPVNDIEFSADGRELFTWCFDEQLIRCLDLTTSKELQTIKAPFREVTLLPNAERYVATDVRGRRVVRGLVKQYEELELPKADSLETIIGMSSDGRRVVIVQAPTSGDHNPFAAAGQPDAPAQLQIWDLEARKLQVVLPFEHVRRLGRFTISSNGKSVATCGLQIVQWNAQTGEPLSTPEGHSGSVNDIAFSKDGSLLATVSEEDSSARVWQIASKELLHTFSEPHGPNWPDYARPWQARSVTWMKAGEIAAAPIKNGMRTWRIDKPSTFHDRTLEFDRESNGFLASLTTIGGQLAAAYGDHVYLFDRSNRPTGKLSDHWGGVSVLAATPDGSYLASGSLDRSVVLWDMKTRKPLHVLDGTRGTIRSVSLSSDGRVVAAASDDGDAIIWEGTSGKVLHYFDKAVERGASTVGVSPDGKLTAVGGKDLQLYETKSGKELVRVIDLSGWIGAMEFSPDGALLATAIGRRGPVLWSVKKLLAAAETTDEQ
jgi:WD40 repeat protein